MTTSAYAPAPTYTISGIGPYDAPFEYEDASELKVSILIGDVLELVDTADYSVVPSGPATSGTVFLASAFATSHDGTTIVLERDTATEQNWVGLGSTAEELEAQLDAMSRAIQENQTAAESSLRVVSKALSPYQPQDGRVPYWDATLGSFANGLNYSELEAGVAAATSASERVDIALHAISGGKWRADVTALLADVALTYTPGETGSIAEGDRILTQSEGFGYAVAASTATDHNLTTAGGVKLYAQPIFSATGQSFTAKQFGAVDGTDITDALQAAIDAALYNVDRVGEYMQDVLIDVHEGALSRTIHCSYGGASYKSIIVSGLGSLAGSGITTEAHAGTVLEYLPKSGCAFAIQGGRQPTLRGFTIRGQAYDSIKDMVLVGSSEAFLIPENFDAKTWDAAMYAGGVVPNRRYAPYAAVAIDPRSGNRKADIAISAMTAASPAVITTDVTHDLNTNNPEAITVSGLSAQGIADGEYYAIYLTTTTAELWNLDWTATTGTGTGTGTLEYSYYDAPTYPGAEGALDPDTEKKRTSAFTLDDVKIEGFEVGTVVNPGTLGANGDFGEFLHVDTYYVKFAHSVCHPNARTNVYYRCTPFGVYSYLATGAYGSGLGYFNARVEGMGGGYMVKWFEVPSSTRLGHTVFDSCHPEGVGMIGTTFGAASVSSPVLFTNCVVKFNHEWISPPSLIENPASDPMPVTFIGGEIRGYWGMSIMSENLKVIGTFVDKTTDPDKSYRAQAYNNALICAKRHYVSLGNPVQRRFNISTVAIANTTDTGEGLIDTGREFCLPYHARIVARDANNENVGMPVTVPAFFLTIGSGARSFGATPIGDRSITFTFTSYSGTRMRQNGIANGCVLVDQGSGVVMIIRSVDYATREIVATLETNWYDNGVDPAGLFDPSWDYTLNTWYLYRTDIFTPPSRIFGTFTSGSKVITNVYSTGLADQPNYGLAIGDWLSSRYGPAGVYVNDDTEIAAIDTVANTITLKTNARRSVADVPLDFWMRAALANETAV